MKLDHIRDHAAAKIARLDLAEQRLVDAKTPYSFVDVALVRNAVLLQLRDHGEPNALMRECWPHATGSYLMGLCENFVRRVELMHKP